MRKSTMVATAVIIAAAAAFLMIGQLLVKRAADGRAVDVADVLDGTAAGVPGLIS